ncbi:hypothetical protein B0H15DRAFT_852972 [Mycena belliarum]|uniref:Uncharacterized protein n=1 Tax=Mycena belliarum TaxID=1033014 RepID=A0AAD6XRG7_9AGAR|nr:hypothetical protein B0H15DRAFT_852972 [Mycena belliae]
MRSSSRALALSTLVALALQQCHGYPAPHARARLSKDPRWLYLSISVSRCNARSLAHLGPASVRLEPCRLRAACALLLDALLSSPPSASSAAPRPRAPVTRRLPPRPNSELQTRTRIIPRFRKPPRTPVSRLACGRCTRLPHLLSFPPPPRIPLLPRRGLPYEARGRPRRPALSMLASRTRPKPCSPARANAWVLRRTSSQDPGLGVAVGAYTQKS